MREDTLAHLSGYNVKLDRRHDRRALSDDELACLIGATEQGPVVSGLSRAERAILYQLAVGTGFRANELRSLVPESFDLDADPPSVTVEAGYSKRRRRDVQEIRVDLAELLMAWLADKAPGERVFCLPDKPGKMLRRDLEAARQAWLDEARTSQQREERERSSFLVYRDDSGCVVDFHALRHTFISNLMRSGAGVKVCQELARHSDPKLTLGVYTHLQVHDKTTALDALPPVRVGKPERESARATGTYDVMANHPASLLQTRAAHAQRAGAPKGDSVLSHATSKQGQGESRKHLQTKEKRVSSRGKEAHARVAQLDRASVYGTEGCRFESCRA